MTSEDPLFHPGWIEFNRQQWGLKAEVIELGPRKGTSWQLTTVLYTNRRGQLVNPPRNPHIPVHFECSSNKPSSINRRKRVALQALAERYQQYKIKGGINLSPVVNDVRPFQWKGLSATPRYTYHIGMNGYRDSIDSRVLKKASKAKTLGYYCETSNDFLAVQECLTEPENRNNFNHSVNETDLKKLNFLMGSDSFCAILAYNSEGKPAGARLLLYTEGGIAMAWSAGIKSEALKDGVNNFLGAYALEFFSNKNCKTFDFVGANIPPVAEMKEAWGGDLVCYYTIREQNIRNLARDAYFTAKRYIKK